MGIFTVDGIVSGYNGQYPTSILYNSITSVASQFYSLWTATGMPGAGSAPGTAAGTAYNSSTTGAIPLPTLSSGQSLYMLNANLACSSSHFGVFIYDKLVATATLSGTVTTAQTVNSTALPRYTDGAGVELWLEWYSATGATSVTATISYTNQAGTSGKTATATIASSTPANRLQRVTLAAGDTGVRSVQSVTLSASTLTAGNFGISLMKKIMSVPFSTGAPVNLGPLDMGLIKLADQGASQPCLVPVLLCNTTTTGILAGDIIFGVG